jgi:hypothetical protein
MHACNIRLLLVLVIIISLSLSLYRSLYLEGAKLAGSPS